MPRFSISRCTIRDVSSSSMERITRDLHQLGDLQAHVGQQQADLQADEAGPDDDGAAGAPVTDPGHELFRRGERLEVVDAGLVLALEGRVQARAGGQHQPVVGDYLAAGRRRSRLSGVYRLHLRSGPVVDAQRLGEVPALPEVDVPARW